MNLLNPAFLTCILISASSFSCTPPEESSSNKAIPYGISYAADFPGSARRDLQFLELLNNKTDIATSNDSKPSCATEINTSEEVIAIVATRTSYGSPRDHLSVETNTRGHIKLPRSLAPYAPEH